MEFDGVANQAVNLTPAIAGNDGIGVKAKFGLYAIASDGSAQPVPQANGVFIVPAAAHGTMTTLRLDTEPAFMGATSADVSVTALQGGSSVANSDPVNGKPNNYLCTVTQNGVIHSELIYVSFN